MVALALVALALVVPVGGGTAYSLLLVLLRHSRRAYRPVATHARGMQRSRMGHEYVARITTHARGSRLTRESYDAHMRVMTHARGSRLHSYKTLMAYSDCSACATKGFSYKKFIVGACNAHHKTLIIYSCAEIPSRI